MQPIFYSSINFSSWRSMAEYKPYKLFQSQIICKSNLLTASLNANGYQQLFSGYLWPCHHPTGSFPLFTLIVASISTPTFPTLHPSHSPTPPAPPTWPDIERPYLGFLLQLLSGEPGISCWHCSLVLSAHDWWARKSMENRPGLQSPPKERPEAATHRCVSGHTSFLDGCGEPWDHTPHLNQRKSWN